MERDRKAGPLHCVIDLFRAAVQGTRAADFAQARARPPSRTLGIVRARSSRSTSCMPHCAGIAMVAEDRTHVAHGVLPATGSELSLILSWRRARPAARAGLSVEADQDDRAVHAGIAGRCAGAAGQQHLVPRLGQTIVLENRPGAGTTIGTKIAASADPDGYTLMIAATSFVISSVMYPNPGYDPLKSFDAVAIPGAQPAGAGDHAGRAGEDGARNSSPMRTPTRASSISASGSARCRRSWANISRCSPRPTSPAFPTRAASRSASTCWAGASR